ncbi:MAG: chromosome segregation protein SMC [Eubacterium sp.]|nr:chromosome segregation protein SMC [Eubacterium sp.]
MLLRTLEMQGFKSFPDKTELNFGKGITAVVGPNGSGKSNISDAVRWVLGETSTKSLRGSKMEDVIFGGTSSRKPLGFAQVVLTLDNSDGSLKDKGEVVTVSRRYYRSGESEYKIDGEQVRRRDVHELFMDTGLGADGYSMVGQGKIDSIISAKNEDRRELFEEAAGISRFRHKRRDAERRLEQAQENLIRLLDILGELESRVGPLKTQSEKAKKYLELAEEKKTLEIGVWLNKINRFTNDLREQEHRIEAADASYEVCNNEILKLEEEMAKVSQSVADANIKIEELRASAVSYDEDALHKESEINVLNARINHNNDMINRLKGDISASDNMGKSFDDEIAEKQAFITENEAALEVKRAELQGVMGELESVRLSDEENSKRSVELSRLLSELTLKLSDCRVKASQALTSIEEIKSRMGTVDEAIAAFDGELEAADAQKAESEANLTFIKERIDEYENSMEGYSLKVKSKNERAEKLREELEKLSRAADEKRSKAKMLSDLEKNMDGFSGAVKTVMKQSQANALPGIHGTLSQLISVNNEYSVAIEVALGAAMQNIVTSTESDAKKAILFLKQNNQGRATFLPISAIKPRFMEEKDLDDNFGFIDIASNLVDCDSQYKDIISNLLGRVMIVEDIDCAIGIAKRYKNRYKIVTLDGQVMNPGGSMTGGSKAKGAGVLSRANLIEELNAEADKLDAQKEKTAAEYKTAVEELNKANADLQGADADLRNAKEELIRAEGDDRIISDKIKTLTDQKQALITEKENADGRIMLFSEAHSIAERDAASIQSDIDKNEAELNSITQGATELNEKRETVRARSEEINLALVTLAKDTEAARRSIEDIRLRQSTQSDRVRSIYEEIEQLEQNNKEIAASIELIKSEAEQQRSKSAETQENVKSLIEVRNELEKSIGEMNAAEKERTTEREKLSTERAKLEERRNGMTREFDELTNLLYEQYELTKAQAEEMNIVIEDMTEAKRRLNEIKASIRKLGTINVGAIEEYAEVSERYEFLKEQISDVEGAKSELQSIISDLTASMSEKFLAQFNKINEQFKLSFADFFGGGRGELILDDPDDCLECPIEIKIQPPGKSVQNINLFSGGEKSLAAMALLFSVLKVTPSPFCIYDEVEAALDEVNVERFAKYMRKMTDKTQFISITHRRGTMEEADVLYGVTMQEKGVSKLLELQSAELAEKMGLE